VRTFLLYLIAGGATGAVHYLFHALVRGQSEEANKGLVWAIAFWPLALILGLFPQILGGDAPRTPAQYKARDKERVLDFLFVIAALIAIAAAIWATTAFELLPEPD
jgi:hypothetical protein